MTTYYADGRPASVGGQPVRYDAGGRAHVSKGEVDMGLRSRKKSDLVALDLIEGLAKTVPDTLGEAQVILEKVYEIARSRMTA